MQQPRVGERNTTASQGHNDFHPLQMIVIAFMIASCAIFLYIIIAYLATSHDQFPIRSDYFILSSIVILLSGQGLRGITQHFDSEHSKRLLLHLVFVLVLNLSFLVFQYLGWKEVSAESDVLPTAGSLSFFFILMITHAGIVATATLITFVSTAQLAQKLKDAISRLVFYSNKYERLKLTLLNRVWLFLQISWLFIYVTFLLTN